MALLTAQGISRVAIDLLVRTLVLPRTVTQVPGDEFAGSNGDTLTLRVPQPGAAREQETRGATITFDDIDEIPVDVSMSHLYHAKLLTDEEASFDLESFASQITPVQVAAVATAAEDELADVMNDLDADATFAASPSTSDTIAKILEAREELGKNDVPAGGRWFAVAPDVASRFLQVDHFVKANESGSDNALRNAIIGRIFGFNVVESNALDAGTAVAYHTSAFGMALRVPPNPRGAQDSAAISSQGIGLRQLFEYQPTRLADSSIVSTFAGAAAVYEDVTGTVAKRFWKMDSAAS